MRFFPGGFAPTVHFDSPTGDRIQKLYDTRFDGSSLRLVESGSFDRQARIEAEAPFCDINYMLQRLSIGDRNVLNSSQPLYGDFSGLPSNPIDAINVMHTAERRFNLLSADEKKAFGNDYRVWLYSVMHGCSTPVGGSDPVPGVAPDPNVNPVSGGTLNES